ncbi:hypothetical protein [Rosistilla oblonga]|uniref:hypothetical protein n=1 Tax=Rosistilla oblonga TaxID=2527990 RepID=UPI0011A16905|nr:hypothetical protein [Rosistilla oblonga]
MKLTSEVRAAEEAAKISCAKESGKREVPEVTIVVAHSRTIDTANASFYRNVIGWRRGGSQQGDPWARAIFYCFSTVSAFSC